MLKFGKLRWSFQVSSHFAERGNDTLKVLDIETLNDFVKFQVEQEDGRRVKNKPLIENLQVKKKKLVEALCKVSYDDFLSCDKIVSCFVIFVWNNEKFRLE